MVVPLLCGRTLLQNPCQTSLLLLLQMIWCNANRYLPWLWNLFLADYVIALSTQSLVSALAMSLESHLFCLQPFSSLWMFISLDRMMLPDKTKSQVNLYLVLTLVDTRRIWKLGKKSPAQLSLANKLCSLALCFDL